MNVLQRVTVAAFAVLASLEMISCSGGSGALPVAAVKNQAPVTQGSANEKLSIKIPLANTSSATRRHPAFISPATASMKVTILSSSGATVVNQTLALTASSPGCSPTPNSILCTTTFALDPGSYTASVTLFDANNNALSGAQDVPFTVVANQNNAIVMTLDGVPASVVVAPLAGQAWVSGNQTSGFNLQSGKVTQFSALAYDADGNAIVGPGSPTIAVSTSSTDVTLVAPSASAPNTFSVTGNFTPSVGTASLTVSATPPGGTALTQHIALAGPLQQLLVGRNDNLAFFASVATLFEPESSQETSVFQGGGGESIVAIDSAGNIYSALAGAVVTGLPTVSEFSAQTVGTSASPAPVTFSETVAPDGDMGTIGTDDAGNLYVSDHGSLSQYRFGSSSPVRTLTGWLQQTGDGSPFAIGFDANGDVAGLDLNGLVQEFAPGSTTPLRQMSIVQTEPTFSSGAYTNINRLPTLVEMPQAIAVDLSGNVYVTGGDNASGGLCNSASGTFIVEYPPGSSTTASRILTIPSSLNTCLSAAITTDTAGNLWALVVANNGSNAIGTTSDVLEYGPTGSAPIQTYPLTGKAFAIVVDAGGDQYISLNTSSGAQVDEMLPGTTLPATTLVVGGGSYLPLALTP